MLLFLILEEVIEQEQRMQGKSIRTRLHQGKPTSTLVNIHANKADAILERCLIAELESVVEV